MPDGGSSLLVPARAGLGRAAEMALLGERIPARARAGVGPGHARDRRRRASRRRSTRSPSAWPPGPTRAYAGTKRALNAGVFAGLDEQLELEAALQQELAASGDFAEGVRAFTEKRDARFAGE